MKSSYSSYDGGSPTSKGGRTDRSGLGEDAVYSPHNHGERRMVRKEIDYGKQGLKCATYNEHLTLMKAEQKRRQKANASPVRKHEEVYKTTQIGEYKNYYALPRYEHGDQGVIHPSPIKKRQHSPTKLETKVAGDLIRSLESGYGKQGGGARLQSGDRVEVKNKKSRKFREGRIQRDRGDGTYDVDYDIKNLDLGFEAETKYLAGQYPDERKKHRLVGMADELARPQPDTAAIQAVQRQYERLKKIEDDKEKQRLDPKKYGHVKGSDRAAEKRKLTRLKQLKDRKTIKVRGADRAKVALWKYMNFLCDSKKMDENGINIKQVQLQAKNKKLFTWLFKEMKKNPGAMSLSKSQYGDAKPNANEFKTILCLMIPEYAGRPSDFEELFWVLGVYGKGWDLKDIKLDRDHFLEQKNPQPPSMSNTMKSKKKGNDMFAGMTDSDEEDSNQRLREENQLKVDSIKLNLSVIDSEFAVTFLASKEYKDYEKSWKVKLNLENLHDKKMAWLDPIAKNSRKVKCKKIKQQVIDVIKALKDAYQKYSINRVAITECQNDFTEQITELITYYMERDKTVNNFMSSLQIQKGSNITDEDLTRQLAKLKSEKSKQMKEIDKLIERIKVECVSNREFFSFYDVPELLIKCKMPNEQYARAIKFLNSVREIYLDQKLIDEREKLREAARKDGDESSNETLSDIGSFDDGEGGFKDKEEDDPFADMFSDKKKKKVDPFEEMRKKSMKSWAKEQKDFDNRLYQADLKNDRLANKMVKKPEDLRKEDVMVTDEDMIHFDYLYQARDLKQAKLTKKYTQIGNQFIQLSIISGTNEGLAQTCNKNPSLMKANKHKFQAHILNVVLEDYHTDLVKIGFKLSQLQYRFVSRHKKNYDDPEEFRKVFKTCVHIEKETAKLNKEYLMNLERELEVFRGNVKAEAVNEGETMSTFSVQSSLKKSNRGGSPDGKSVRIGGMDPDAAGKRDRANIDIMLGQNEFEDDMDYNSEDDMNDGNMNNNDFMERQKAAEAEEAAEAEKLAALDRAEKDEREMQKFFVELDEDGKWTKQYDRKKKFGEIMNEDQLVYEPPEELEEAMEALYENQENMDQDPSNIYYVKMKVLLTSKIAGLQARGIEPGSGKGLITTSYKLNLPPEYYMKQIQKSLPTDDVNGEQWFIRPHHIESLTNHARSIRDDFMNTNYYSYYNNNYEPITEGSTKRVLKEKVIRDKVECLKQLKEYIDNLKERQKYYIKHPKIGKDYDEMLRAQAKEMDDKNDENMEMFSAFMKDKKQNNPKKLVIDAYEAMNTVQRGNEREILNEKRFEEYEKNRPPSDKWWEVKTKNFNAEVVRNRVSLDGNKNADYLEKLQDRNIY